MRKIFVICVFILLSSFQFENNDVVAKFEELLKDHFDSYTENPREQLALLGGGWVKERFSLEGKYEYDIKSSSSLISPYEGECIFILKKEFTKFHKSKEEALFDNEFTQETYTKHKHLYLYKKDKWIIDKRQNTSIGNTRGWYDCNEIIKSGEDEGKSNIHGCWEHNF